MKKTILAFILLSHLIFYTNAQENCYWQQKVEYKMDVDFDVKNHQFKGVQVLKYYNNSPDTLHKVFYHLYFNAFQPNSMMDVRSLNIQDSDPRVKDRISKLKKEEYGYQKILKLIQEGENLEFHTEQTILEVILKKPILPNTSTVFSMNFEGQVPVQIRRSGRNNSEEISYSMSQWYPKIAEYDSKGWHAHPYIAREFYAPWGNFEVNISIDRNYMIAATGLLKNANEIGFGYAKDDAELLKKNKRKQKKDKKLTWKFKAENVHDFVWAADTDYVHVTAQVPEGPLLRFFYQKNEKTKAWEQLPEYAVKAFLFIQKKFGKYPYPQYSIIQGGDGGMEYPMATLITGHRSLSSLVGVTVHEVLHSWHQGLLATNESYLAWMDEGFTTYASNITMAHLFGSDMNASQRRSHKGYFLLAMSGKEEPLSTHSDQFETNMAYSLGSYAKGAVSLDQLGYIMGDENRNKGLLRYFDTWKFKHPQLNDFVRVMEKTSGLELDWFFDYWVNSTKTIDYEIENVEANESATMLSLQRIGNIPMPIDVIVEYNDGTKECFYIPLSIMRGEKPKETNFKRVLLKDWAWTHKNYQFEISRSMKDILSIEIDPSKRMADINRKNNLWSKTQ